MLLPSEIARLEEHLVTVPFTGCWIWLGTLDSDGYGRVRVDGRKTTGVHRLVYQTIIGPIPDELELDHLCRVRCCANPDHLEAVTHHENVVRGLVGKHWSTRDVCHKGHPFDEANTRYRYGWRNCRACGREKTQRYRDKQAAINKQLPGA